MPSVIVVDPDGREYPVMTAEALVWAVYGRGAELKTGTYQENLQILQGGDPPAPNTLRHVTLADLADFFSPAAVSIRAGLENASVVNPSGAWDFDQAPKVNGVALGSGGSTVDATETVKGIVELATVAEATTGSDTTRAVTPAGAKATAETAGTGDPTPNTVMRRYADGMTSVTQIYLEDPAPTLPNQGARKDYVDTAVATRAATSHTHVATAISDSTATGRSVLTATDATAARTAIGAGTGNSNLTLGTTSTTAKAGDYAPPADAAAGTASMRTLGTGATQALPGNHVSTTNARTPTAHTHGVTDLTATGTRDSTTYLRGDNVWAAPPAGGGGWTAVDASETVKGIVELATTAEATTGTDTVRAVTPAGVKAVADTKAATSHTHTAANISDSTATGRSILTAADAAAVRTAAGAAPTSHTHGVADLTATGTKDSTTVLHGDNVFRVPAGGGGGWTAVDATETVKGIVELATTTETTTGTDTVRAVTPAGVKAVADTKAATSHTHTASQVSDSTATGRSVMTAVDATAARTAIGAGTGNSNLAIGTTSTTAKAGDYTPPIDQAAGTASMRTLGTGATQAAAGNDSRLSDARTPTTHTHTASQVSDSTTVGRSVLTAASAAAGRTAIGAGVVDSSDGTVLNIVKITQANYDALGTKIATTQYNIVG